MTRKQKTKMKLMGIPRKAKSVYMWLMVNIIMTFLCVAACFVSLFAILIFKNPYTLARDLIVDELLGGLSPFYELIGSFEQIDADIYFKHFNEDKE